MTSSRMANDSSKHITLHTNIKTFHLELIDAQIRSGLIKRKQTAKPRSDGINIPGECGH